VRDVAPDALRPHLPDRDAGRPNIGLINSLATFARVNKYGFIETPFRRVRDGLVTAEVIYLSAMEEGEVQRRPGNADIDGDGRLTEDRGLPPRGDVIVVPPDRVDLMDVSPKQLVSVAAA
jgi:DNA-directed RNA polymerase subunit beta